MTPLAQAKQLIEEAEEYPDRWERHGAAAQAILQSAVTAEPANPALLIGLGAVLSDRGQHARAVQVLEKSIELGSSDRNAYLNLAIALMNCDAAGRARAQAFFQKARELSPSPETWEAYFDPHAH